MPTPNGRFVAADFVRFFLQNHIRLETLLSNDPTPTELWELLFMLRFGQAPESGQSESYRVKRGSTDPRWDVFLHTEKALRIVVNLRKLWLRKSGP